MKRRIIYTGLAVGLIGLVMAGIRLSPSRREAIMCGNQMNALHIAAISFGIDQENQLPRDLLSMSNEVNNPAILICPGERSKKRVTNWSALTTNNISYDLVTPGLSMEDTNGVFLRCPIHGFVVRSTGVFDGTKPVRKSNQGPH